MSLLLDALNKAGDTDSKSGDFPAIQLEEVNVEPVRKSKAQADAMRVTGENLFAAKKAPADKRPRPSIVPISLIVGGILTAGGGYYLYLETTFFDGHDERVAHANGIRSNTPHTSSGVLADVGSREPQRGVSVDHRLVNSTSTPSASLVPRAVMAASHHVGAASAPALVELEPLSELALPVADKSIVATSRAKKSASDKKTPRVAHIAQEKSFDIRHEQESDSLDAILARAYKSYKKGDYATASQHYREALSLAPKNRDALLGLAVIAQQQEDDDAALSYYRQVLVLDPRDPVAHAGMAFFNRGDTSTKESRLQQLISQQPDSAALHFALGNQYVEQSRWSDAQQAYFNALAMEPGNALFAFNLAISLDHLGQRKAAAKYYQQAMQFDPSGNSGFSRIQVQQRLNELTTSVQ